MAVALEPTASHSWKYMGLSKVGRALLETEESEEAGGVSRRQKATELLYLGTFMGLVVGPGKRLR